jgi:hypothetical protein
MQEADAAVPQVMREKFGAPAARHATSPRAIARSRSVEGRSDTAWDAMRAARAKSRRYALDGDADSAGA